MKLMKGSKLLLLTMAIIALLSVSVFSGVNLEYKFKKGEVTKYNMKMGCKFEVDVPQKANVSGDIDYSSKQEIKVLNIDEDGNGVLEQSMSSPNITFSSKVTEPNAPPQETKVIINESGTKMIINGVEQQSDPNMQNAMMDSFTQKTEVVMSPKGKFVKMNFLTGPMAAPSPTPGATPQGTQPGAPPPASPQQAMQENLMKQFSEFSPSLPEGTIEVGHQWSNEIDIAKLLQAFGFIGEIDKIKIDNKLSSLDEKYGEKSANIVSTIVWNVDNKSITSFMGILNIKKLSFNGTGVQNFGYEIGDALASTFNGVVDADISLTPMGTQEPPQSLKFKFNINFKMELEK